MKINFKVAKQKDIYEVGDVFRSKNYLLYLVVNDTNAWICTYLSKRKCHYRKI